MNEIEKKGKRPTTHVGPKSCGQRTAYCTCTASQHHYASLRLTRLERRPNSPADVAAEDGARVHVVVDGAGDDRRGHRELDGSGVDDADDVARAGGLEDAEERAVAAVLRVQLDDLLVVVRALEELDSGVERPAVGL